MSEWNIINRSNLSETWRFDSEYWRVRYIDNLRTIKASTKGGLRTSKIKYVVDKVTGSAFYPSFARYYDDKGMPFIRVADLGDLYLKSEGMVRISQKTIMNHKQVSTIMPGDLVIAKGGSIGSVCIVTEDLGESAVCRDVVAIKSNNEKLDPYYLAVFLNTYFGNLQLERNKSLQVQAHLTFPAVERIEVAYPDYSFQKDIRELALKARIALTTSKQCNELARKILEAETGLDRYTYQRPERHSVRYSTISLSQTFSAGRVDAQCFSPDAIFYEKWLNSQIKCDRLGLLLRSTAKGHLQTDQIDGAVHYCSIKNISNREILGSSLCTPDNKAPLAKVDDLLLAITGATIGKIGIVKRYKEIAFSGDMLCLKTNEKIDPHYLLAVLDHQIGRVQFERWVTGSTNGHLAPKDVKRVLVPRLNYRKEEMIAKLIKRELSKRLDSEMFIEQAKNKVVNLIEQAVKQ